MLVWSSAGTGIDVRNHPDYVYCDETSEWLPKDKVMSIKGVGTRKIRYGRWGVRYVKYPYQGFVKVLCFTTRNVKSEYLFGKDVTTKEIEECLFKNIDHHVYLSLSPKHKTLYRATYRYTVFSLDEWVKKYTPNSCLSRYKTVDKALLSISELLSTVDEKREIRTSTPHGAIAEARELIEIARMGLLLAAPEKIPCVELYAIWLNFDPDTGYINLGDYSGTEPTLYEYRIIKNKKDLVRL